MVTLYVCVGVLLSMYFTTKTFPNKPQKGKGWASRPRPGAAPTGPRSSLGLRRCLTSISVVLSVSSACGHSRHDSTSCPRAGSLPPAPQRPPSSGPPPQPHGTASSAGPFPHPLGGGGGSHLSVRRRQGRDTGLFLVLGPWCLQSPRRQGGQSTQPDVHGSQGVRWSERSRGGAQGSRL